MPLAPRPSLSAFVGAAMAAAGVAVAVVSVALDRRRIPVTVRGALP